MLERIGRRSVCFSAHWLLAIGRVLDGLHDDCAEVSHPAERSDLLHWASALHLELGHLRDELPPYGDQLCD